MSGPIWETVEFNNGKGVTRRGKFIRNIKHRYFPDDSVNLKQMSLVQLEGYKHPIKVLTASLLFID